MFRPRFAVTQLEDRCTPVSLGFSLQIGVAASLDAAIPPSDPMDNPPPVQPGTGGTGSTTPPTPLPPPAPAPTPPTA